MHFLESRTVERQQKLGKVYSSAPLLQMRKLRPSEEVDFDPGSVVG